MFERGKAFQIYNLTKIILIYLNITKDWCTLTFRSLQESTIKSPKYYKSDIY